MRVQNGFKISYFLVLINFSLFGQIDKKPNVEFLRFSNENLEKHSDENIRLFSRFSTEGPMNLIHLIDFPADEYTFHIRRSLVADKNDKDKFFEVYSFSCEDKKDSYVPYCADWALPGERVEFFIQSKKTNFKYIGTFIPNPIRGKDKKGNVIFTVELVSTNTSSYDYVVSTPGIFMGEKILIELISPKEKNKKSLTVFNENTILIQPNISGILGGYSIFKITRANGEVISVQLPFGTELRKYDFPNPLIYDVEG